MISVGGSASFAASRYPTALDWTKSSAAISAAEGIIAESKATPSGKSGRAGPVRFARSRYRWSGGAAHRIAAGTATISTSGKFKARPSGNRNGAARASFAGGLSRMNLESMPFTAPLGAKSEPPIADSTLVRGLSEPRSIEEMATRIRADDLRKLPPRRRRYNYRSVRKHLTSIASCRARGAGASDCRRRISGAPEIRRAHGPLKAGKRGRQAHQPQRLAA